MSEHSVRIDWKLKAGDDAKSFSRDHSWSFEGGAHVLASSAPGYGGNAELVDPEQALVAALASCHMLTFLAIASKMRLSVTSYSDDATGSLEKNAAGRLAVTRITLRPRIAFAADAPDAPALRALHDKAHRHCFIAASISADVAIEPVL